MTARATTTGKKTVQAGKSNRPMADTQTTRTPDTAKATSDSPETAIAPAAVPTTRTTPSKAAIATRSATKKAAGTPAAATGTAAKTAGRPFEASKAVTDKPQAEAVESKPDKVNPAAGKSAANKPATAKTTTSASPTVKTPAAKTTDEKTTATKAAAASAKERSAVVKPVQDKSAAPQATAPTAVKPVESTSSAPAVSSPATKTPPRLSPAVMAPARAGASKNPPVARSFATADTSSTEQKAAPSRGIAAAAPTTTPATPVSETPAPLATQQVTAPAAETMPRATPTGPEAPEATVGTDAAFASTVPCQDVLHTLRNISEVRHFFRTNDVPIFFVGATPFNLLGLDRWVRNFTYVSYYDAWDGAHPRVFTPAYKPYREFGSGEEINNWLLLNPEVRARMTKDLRPGVRPKVAMVFFDEETEQICDELGYDLILPSAQLRHRLDSKITTTLLGNEAGVRSVPNVLGTGVDYKTLRAEADAAGLGEDLVVQTPYGDSGKTTYFIGSEEDWEKNSTGIVGEQIKVMRRINNLPVAVEAVLTRSGTLVGPFLTELAGHGDLTPYPGGWCGNEMHPEVFTDSQRARATELVKRMGKRLSTEGYRGFFEVDVLVDTDTDEVYLGELNPRISGASAITNVTAGAYADVPLFLFHLLEYMEVEFDLDIDEINARWEALSGADVWSQMVIKETSQTLELLTATPPTGQYHLDANGALVFGRQAMDWHMLQNESEAFFLRIYGPGDYRWKGADLGILVTKGRLQVERNGSRQLSIRARHFIDSIRAGFSGLPLGGAELERGIRSEAPAGNLASGARTEVQSKW